MPRRILLTCAIGLFAAVAHGALQHGDILIAGGLPAAVGYDGWLRTYSRPGQLGAEVHVAAPLVNLAVHDGSVFAKDVNGGVVRVGTDGSLLSPGFSAIGPFFFDQLGWTYACTWNVLTVYDRAGQPRGSWQLPTAPAMMDLDGDHCTLYYIPYSSTSSIEMYDLCAGKPLPPLIVGLPGTIGDLRVLPFGSGSSVLLGTNGGVVMINVGGRIERIYRGYRQIALDVDRHSFWTAGADDRALKIDLITGDIVASTTPATGSAGLPATSITVVDEPRAAMGDALWWTPQLPTTTDTITVGLEGWNSWCSQLRSVTVSDGVVTLSLQGAVCGTPTILQSSYAIGPMPAGHYVLKVIREGVPIGDAEFDVTVPVSAIGTTTAILLCAALIGIAWIMLRPA